MLNYFKTNPAHLPSRKVFSAWAKNRTYSLLFTAGARPIFDAGVEGLYDIFSASRDFRRDFGSDRANFCIPSGLVRSVYEKWKLIDQASLSEAMREYAGGDAHFLDGDTPETAPSVTNTWIALCKLDGLNPLFPGVLPFAYQIDEVVKFQNGEWRVLSLC